MLKWSFNYGLFHLPDEIPHRLLQVIRDGAFPAIRIKLRDPASLDTIIPDNIRQGSSKGDMLRLLIKIFLTVELRNENV